MGHDKLRKFAENETFSCLIQPSSQELLADGFFALRDHEMKGRWNAAMFPEGKADAPIVLELGCGKGEYTIDLAQRDPGTNFIGVDIKGARLWKGAKYATENKMPNVAFLRSRIELISCYFAPGEVSEIWLTFSDPRFKKENTRLTAPIFLERYRSFMKKGGIVHLKTDSQFLFQYTKAMCAANGLKVLVCTEDLYGEAQTLDVHPSVYEVQTFYERMFLDQGYKINYMSFVIDHEGEFVSPEFDVEYWRSVEGPRLLFGHDSAETRRQAIRKSRKAEE